MTATLTILEFIQQRTATEKAIAKLLSELQEQTGAIITGLSTVKLIGDKGSKILKVHIETL